MVSEHDTRQLWEILITFEEEQNITYRRRRYRSVEDRTCEMDARKRIAINPTDEVSKEDMLVKGLMKTLQDLAERQRETREFMGKLATYTFANRHGEERVESSSKDLLDEGRNSTKSNHEVITPRTNPQARPQDFNEIPRSTMPKFLGPPETGIGGNFEQELTLIVYF